MSEEPIGRFVAVFVAVRTGFAPMWRTPKGNRTLVGLEAEVFLAGLRALAGELLDQRDDHESEVPTFDVLSLGQRVATLKVIANGLLGSEQPGSRRIPSSVTEQIIHPSV